MAERGAKWNRLREQGVSRIWREGCDLSEKIYRVARKGELSRDYGFRDQLTRAAISIPANIAEGKERQTVPELIRYLYIAKGSSGKLRTLIHIAQRIGYSDGTTFRDLSGRTQILSKKLGSFIRVLRQQKLGNEPARCNTKPENKTGIEESPV